MQLRQAMKLACVKYNYSIVRATLERPYVDTEAKANVRRRNIRRTGQP